jgi:hypothetical protein
MPRIALQQLEALVGEVSNLGGQAPIVLPKPRGRPVPHSSLSFPRCLASNASLTRKSSFPALESSSIC